MLLLHLLESLICAVRATQSVCNLLCTEHAQLSFRIKNHDWEAADQVRASAFLVDSVDPGAIVQDVVTHTHGDSSNQVDATVGEEFECSITCLNSENFSKLANNGFAKLILLQFAS